MSAPWSKILTSKQVWSSIITKTCGSFGYYLIVTELPTYLNNVFGISIVKNGFFNWMINTWALPSLLITGPLSLY